MTRRPELEMACRRPEVVWDAGGYLAATPRQREAVRLCRMGCMVQWHSSSSDGDGRVWELGLRRWFFNSCSTVAVCTNRRSDLELAGRRPVVVWDTHHLRIGFDLAW